MAASEAGQWWSNTTAQAILTHIHFISPILLLAVFLSTFVWHSIVSTATATSSQSRPLGPGGKPLPRGLSPSAKALRARLIVDFSPQRKQTFTWLSALLLLTFVGNGILVVLQAIAKRKHQWWCGESVIVYIAASVFDYSLVMISIIDTKPSPSSYHALTWIIGLITEIFLFGATLAVYTHDHREPTAGRPDGGKLHTHVTTWEAIEIVIDLTRVLCLLAMVFLYSLFVYLRKLGLKKRHADAGSSEETTGLIRNHGNANGTMDQTTNGVASEAPNGQAYGTIDSPHKDVDEPAGWVRPEKVPPRNWWEYVSAYSLFIPYLWPANDTRLQVLVIVCFTLMGLARAVNIMVPIVAERVTNILAGEDGPSYLPVAEIILYIVLRLLQGSSGILAALRDYLWIPVSQYSYLELSVASFEHVHGLSLDFHLGKKTGEVLSALNKGASINTFLGQVTFQFIPMVADLAVAIAYLFIDFDTYYALVVAIVSFAYMYVTIRMAQWRSPIRREMTNLDRESEAVKNDSMTSYETVKYFNAEPFEFKRYRDAILGYQGAEYQNNSSLNLMNVSQNCLFTIGLLVTSFIAAYQVTTGQIKVGKFVALLTLMAQLQQPLNFLGTFYRVIQQAMINAERLLELFKEQPTVVDVSRAKELDTCEGKISFNDVKFSYDPRRPALDGLSFTCAPGTTTALVGESGGGKSTVFRLLFRFYNIGGGSIEIDGNNVEDITIDSLRRHIGVVPQDTVLFNESLMFNLKYANQDATDEQIFAACRAASIHDQIMRFPDGYNSKVGERGLKLSGGEKQRIAIARTILKGPRIILLDEATAALDTETEQDIELALKKLSERRTTLIIAHRLSTIFRADQIVVLHAGKVAECGTHQQLIDLQGRYASMWKKQIRAATAEREAQMMTERAEKLRSEAQGSDSASHSEDEHTSSKARGRPPLELQMTASSFEDAEGDTMHSNHP